SYMPFEAPLSSPFLVSPRLADKAAPAAFCWAFDFAGITVLRECGDVLSHNAHEMEAVPIRPLPRSFGQAEAKALHEPEPGKIGLTGGEDGDVAQLAVTFVPRLPAVADQRQGAPRDRLGRV